MTDHKADRKADRFVRPALLLAVQLMSARVLRDADATAAAVQDIADFLSTDPATTQQRVTAYVHANGHLSSFLVHAASRFADWPVEKMLSQLTLYAASRVDDTRM